MILHETIKRNVAAAIQADSSIAAYAVANFGAPLNVIVNRYGQDGLPGEAESPFCFLYSDGENEMGDVDEETFEFVIVLGAVDPSEVPTREIVAAETADANSLSYNGIADKIETLRSMVEAILVTSTHGAIFRSVTRTESNFNDYPLEWARLRVSYYEPETLD